ncbi:patatin-like phospholipase family protein [Rufibacter sediminis]|uniref:Patatin-like phospholipase family protein n=1 Tax=Rufibacter sediminis TaxID=2762756 RepID=A0ABR6VSQ5_9BACT|nr:patatin-like phospholipase family protein [Rufibacter sediminis]MBC3540192.1 patatin-like phospholipase family protein [Rufibacter sediminis]
MQKIGLCLSGGAARGVAHLGVLQAMQEIGVPIHAISGVSSGAIAGAFFAAGFPPEEVLRLVCDLPLPKLLRPAMNRGILHTQALHKIFEEHLQNRTFEELPIKLTISALDLVEGCTVYFTQGSLVEALKASSAVPVLFKPMQLEKRMLVDGGIVNNLPVECITGECDKIIGVHVNPTPHNAEINSIRQVTERIFHLALHANIQSRIALCDLLLEPPRLTEFHVSDLKRAKEMYTIGYEHTMDLAPEIEALAKPVI